MGTIPDAIFEARRWAVRDGAGSWGTRAVPEETAVALTYDRASYAVMMATPRDLEDFGIGFSLTEGIVERPSEIAAMEIAPLELGIEIRMDLAPARAGRAKDRHRKLAGPSGCGLCGVESLAEAIRPLPQVTATLTVTAAMILEAVAALSKAQIINRGTSAVHAAALWKPGLGLTAMREDVGRHNALDKLAGALARAGLSAADGVVVISSRVSVEMVQKAAAIGAPVVVALSAPTALALRSAEAAGITLVAVARADGFEVFTGHRRVLAGIMN